MKSTLWSIGDTAARFDLPTHALRHWEDVGLIHPERDGANRRLYGPDDVVRIAVILRNKAAGMSLEQIGVLLDQDARDRHVVLSAHVAELDRRMVELQRSRDMTEHALRCRAHDVTSCPRFRQHVDDVLDGSARFAVPA